MMDEKIAENFLRLVSDTRKNGVPEMHFRLWRRSPDAVRDKYLAAFRADPEAMAWYEAGYIGEDPDFDALLELPPESLGYQYARHIIDNGLNKTIASDYRRAHERMDAEGKLTGMPDEVKYATLRGFQIHDIFHILTGDLTDARGEMALQAFTLAQRRLPYASIWMATLTTQMTFENPNMTELVMDAISDGWRRGRAARNLNYERWEERLAEPVEDLRREFGVTTATVN
jgi:ubiquinone biosynthesis protein COQ4